MTYAIKASPRVIKIKMYAENLSPFIVASHI